MRASPILLALLLATRAAAQSDDPRAERVTRSLRPVTDVAGRPTARHSLAERLAAHRVPGVSVAVIEGGRIAWARGFGTTEAGAGEPVTPGTLFQAGSMSKPVAVSVMLALAERRALPLDEDVNRRLSSWKVPESRHTASERVTLRRIASHGAGLTGHGFPGYPWGAPLPTLPQILSGAPPAVTAPVRVDTVPGTLSRYSGGGMLVMQQLLVDLTGTPFPALADDLVLRPAGMLSSSYEQPLPAAWRPRAAVAHDMRGRAIPGRWRVYPEMAAGGLWTTPSDLARWMIAIGQAWAGTPGALLSRGTAEEMLTVQRAPFGLGVMVSGAGERLAFGHGGDVIGMNGSMVYHPATGQGAVVMTNADGGQVLVREVLHAVAEEYGWPEPPRYRTLAPVPLTEAQAAGLVGEYEARLTPDQGPIPLVRVRIWREGERLMIESDAAPTQELIPESEDSVTLRDSSWRFPVVRDGSGRVTALRMFGGADARRVR